jgi:hypothetical protein
MLKIGFTVPAVVLALIGALCLPASAGSLRDGHMLAGQKEFGRFDFRSHVPNTEYMANLTLNVSGAPAGDYLLVLTVDDENSGASAKVELPFAIQ